MSVKSYKMLGLLLCYPAPEWVALLREIRDTLADEGQLPASRLEALERLFEFLSANIVEAQETYVATFDRIRSLSLHLFEHVHGESRDRGQAMIDLIERYRETGLMPPSNELPDYLPMFLEYLSHIDATEARAALTEPVHILEAIAKRLQDRESPYLAVFNALLHLAGRPSLRAAHTLIGGTQEKDPTFDDLDKQWAETAVEFLGAASPDAPASQAWCG